MPKKLFSSISSPSSNALSQTTTRSSTTSITSSSSSSSSTPTTFTDNSPLPSIIVFDLDYTLWPFWVDTHVSGPVKPISSTNNTAMVDRWGENYTFYTGVPAILHAAREKGITMSLASRTHAPDLAKEMLRGLNIVSPKKDQQNGQGQGQKAIEFFTHMQIYPGSKTTHFKRLQETIRRKEGRDIPFRDMLFFDDEGRNRNVETELGVTFHLVRDGLTKEEVDQGVWKWRKNTGRLDHRNGKKEGSFGNGADGDGVGVGGRDVAELE